MVIIYQFITIIYNAIIYNWYLLIIIIYNIIIYSYYL